STYKCSFRLRARSGGITGEGRAEGRSTNNNADLNNKELPITSKKAADGNSDSNEHKKKQHHQHSLAREKRLLTDKLKRTLRPESSLFRTSAHRTNIKSPPATGPTAAAAVSPYGEEHTTSSPRADSRNPLLFINTGQRYRLKTVGGGKAASLPRVGNGKQTKKALRDSTTSPPSPFAAEERLVGMESREGGDVGAVKSAASTPGSQGDGRGLRSTVEGSASRVLSAEEKHAGVNGEVIGTGQVPPPVEVRLVSGAGDRDLVESRRGRREGDTGFRMREFVPRRREANASRGALRGSEESTAPEPSSADDESIANGTGVGDKSGSISHVGSGDDGSISQAKGEGRRASSPSSAAAGAGAAPVPAATTTMMSSGKDKTAKPSKPRVVPSDTSGTAFRAYEFVLANDAADVKWKKRSSTTTTLERVINVLSIPPTPRPPGKEQRPSAANVRTPRPAAVSRASRSMGKFSREISRWRKSKWMGTSGPWRIDPPLRCVTINWSPPGDDDGKTSSKVETNPLSCITLN
ncbi:unnamed protein product, partial [Sphacelaria rigidula]